MKLLLPISAKTHVRTYTISKIFRGLYPRTPFKQGKGREGRGEGGWEGGREGRRDGSRNGKGGREGGRKGKGDVCIHASGGIRGADLVNANPESRDWESDPGLQSLRRIVYLTNSQSILNELLFSKC
jgi:hypothetical protein